MDGVNPVILKDLEWGISGALKLLLLFSGATLTNFAFLLFLVFLITGDFSISGVYFWGRFFDNFVIIQVVIIGGLVLPVLAAYSVASERERDCLDFLRMTGMTASEIVRGKIAASLAATAPIALSSAMFIIAVTAYVGFGYIIWLKVIMVIASFITGSYLVASICVYVSIISRKIGSALIAGVALSKLPLLFGLLGLTIIDILAEVQLLPKDQDYLENLGEAVMCYSPILNVYTILQSPSNELLLTAIIAANGMAAFIVMGIFLNRLSSRALAKSMEDQSKDLGRIGKEVFSRMRKARGRGVSTC